MDEVTSPERSGRGGADRGEADRDWADLVLHEWNDTAHPYSRYACIHELFEAQVTRAPDAVALVGDHDQLTYSELNRRANRLAHLLRETGSGPGAFVAMCSDHCIEAIVALLGILKSGAAYVPVDPAWPADRQRQILHSLGATALVTRAAQYRRFFDLSWELPALGTILCIDVDDEELPAERVDEEAVRVLWDMIADEAVDEAWAGGFRRTEDGSLFNLEEVRHYQEHVGDLAAQLVGADGAVLEIGCGSGLHMRRLSPHVGRYAGLDPSAAVQAKNAAWADASGLPVELVTGFAHEAGSLVDGPFDLVALASTVQYFPGPVYLRHILRQAAAMCAPGGHVLLADVLDPGLVEARFGPTVAREKRDRELMLHPSQLHELVGDIAEISSLEVRTRTGFENELACRYDAILTVGVTPRTAPPARRSRTAADLRDLPDTDPTPLATPGDLAYVIFTSGSTGAPKGVMVQHRPVINLVEWVNHTFDVGPTDRLLLVTSFGFDLSVYDLFGILAAGGSVRVACDEDLREPRRLLAMLCTEGITFWDSAPAALYQVMQFADLDRPGLPRGDLRLVFLSGDWVPMTLPDHVRRHFPGTTVVALGGATEATIWSNFFVVGDVEPGWPSIPYGRPIQNARYYVLDDDLRPSALETPGDLYIGGECLAAGYAGDPALTAGKFVPDPHSGVPGAKMYRTGDRARFLPDGNIQFLGRLDHQVKIRGFRVELGEIEAALHGHPAIEVAVVLAQPGPAGDLQLDAYVVPRDGSVPDPAELRAHLGEIVPDYMVPQTFTVLGTMPLSPTGKVDRRALPEPAERRERGPVGEAPRDEFEKLVAAVWSDVLGVGDVGVDDGFFELGGHSLAGARVMARLAEVQQVNLPLRAIFEHPTVAGLAAAVRGAVATEERWPPIERADERSVFPASFLQEQMWGMMAGTPPGAWNETVHHRLPGTVDVTALSRALDWLVERHESLRTCLPQRDGRLYQRVFEAAPVDLPVDDLRDMAPGEREAALDHLIRADNVAAFDLGEGPLFRARLVRVDDGRSELLVTFDHLIVDVTSADILLTELDEVYASFSLGEHPRLAPQPVQYGDFAAWEQRWLTDERREALWDYWRRRLEGMPLAPRLPYDRTPPDVAGPISYVNFTLPPDAFASLTRLVAVSRSSLFILSLAATKILLARLTGETDIVVGTQVGARYRSEVESTVGLFTGAAFLRTDLSGDPTVEAVVQRVSDGVQELFDHQPFPYRRMLAHLAPEVVRQGIPYAQALDPIDVEFFHADRARWSPGMSCVSRPLVGRVPSASPDYSQTIWSITDKPATVLPLEVMAYADGAEMWGRMGYRADFFDQSTVDGLSTGFERLLAGAAGDWGRPISQLKLG